MRKLAIALLATSMFATPGAFAAANNQQQPHGQKTQQDQQQNQQNAQDQHMRNAQPQSAKNNQPSSSQNLSRSQVRQVQQALNKDGFKPGPTDGRLGRETENAVKQFQQSKQLQATGQPDQQTVADLGLDASKFSQSQSRQK